MPHTGIHPYAVPFGSHATISRNQHGPQDGLLLLSIEGEQNPDEACTQATNFQAQIVLLPTGRVSLYWTDQVVNDWSEEYGRLSDAMLRLAGIVRSYESDFDLWFGDGGVAAFEKVTAPKAFGVIFS